MRYQIKKLPIYPGYFGIVEAEHWDQLKKFEFKDVVPGETFASAVDWKYKGFKCVFLVFNTDKDLFKPLSPGDINHEVVHACHIIFGHIEYIVDNNNDESMAYLAGWLTDEVHNFLYGTNYNNQKQILK